MLRKIRSMSISKQQDNHLMEKKFTELSLNTNSQENSLDDVDVELAICTKAVRNKFSKRKSSTQSKKKSFAAMCKEIELQIMDRGDVSIEKVVEQFLVEGSEIENKDGPYTADDYILIPNILNLIFCIFLIKTNIIIIIRRKKRKKGASKRRWFITKGERWIK